MVGIVIGGSRKASLKQPQERNYHDNQKTRKAREKGTLPWHNLYDQRAITAVARRKLGSLRHLRFAFDNIWTGLCNVRFQCKDNRQYMGR